MPPHLAMFGLPGGTEWIFIGLVALLLFGRRMPEVARSVGRSIVEFKKGIKDVKEEIDVRGQIRNDINDAVNSDTDADRKERDAEPAAPKTEHHA